MNDTNYNYPVAVEPLFLANGQATDLLATVRQDTREALGHVSNRYGVIQNGDLLDCVKTGLNQIGLEPSSFNPVVTENGARFHARYDFKSVTSKVPSVGDVCGLRITAKNSFDGSGSTSLQLGILVLTCLNGATRNTNEWALRQTHSGKGDLLTGIRAGLENLIGGFQGAVESFGLLADIGVNTDTGTKLINHFVKEDIIPLRVGTRIDEVWQLPTFQKDRPRNLWSLYNAGTQVLTHEIEDKKFEIAGRINARLSKALFDIAHNPNKINELIALAV